jgi:HD superfamily phosphohydrolase
MRGKPERIRDPVHDLIEFTNDDFEQTVWDALESKEFQRLRRIKQLGFSELVFPGATHSRFAHSVGVFQTARRLSSLIQTRLLSAFNPDRARIATAAALVHDLGHGPFSHAFEDAMKRLGVAKRHEDWTEAIITGDTEVAEVLSKYDAPNFQTDVAALIASETPIDIYSAIVSSQFDADRLDYIRRDRLMTGAQHGGFDFPWLMANLEVDKVAIALDGDEYGEVDSLILGNKAFEAAEEYVLGLFHLYFTVYFHKTTRSAEKMLCAMLHRAGQFIRNGQINQTGMEPSNFVAIFLKQTEPTLASYLRLDDFAVWASIQEMSTAKDASLAELATRLLNRRLYKVIDVSARLAQKGGEASVARFRARLTEARPQLGPIDLLEDQATRNPYKRRSYDSPEALAKVLIRRGDGTAYEDLAERSNVVASLKEQSVFRVYVRNDEVMDRIENILQGIAP